MTASPSSLSETGTGWNRRLLALAGPIVLANLSVPLPGIVDTAVMGHLPEAAGLAAVGLGATVFATLYFTFSFLRMSSVGLTAQAEGAGDAAESRAVLYRGGTIALGLSAIMLVLQAPIGAAAFALVDAAPDVTALGLTYFDIRIWGAPAALLNLAILGWMFGLGSMRQPVTVQVVTNLLNVVLDFVFVFGLGWGIEGVAAATVVAEWAGLALGLIYARRILRRRGDPLGPEAAMFSGPGLKRMFGVNRDIFIRTLCLLIVFAHFKIAGTDFGTETLAANIVLLIFLDLSSYGLDAFANAAEILVGRAVGRRDPAMFRTVVRLAHLWSFAAAFAASALFFVFGGAIVAMLTGQPPVRAEAAVYLFWAALLPSTAVWAFVLDGVFIGATRSAALRNGMIAAVAVYFPLQFWLSGAHGNHGLWLALHIFLIARGVTLAVQYPALARSVQPAGEASGALR